MAKRERPAEYAILGLLYLNDRGGHGYDLVRHFGADQPLGAVLHLEPGMLYHHLKRLEQTGLLSSVAEYDGARPTRQVYSITEEGRAELLRWLQSPVVHTREIRLEFLIKLFFARKLDPILAEQLVQTQLTTLRQVLESLQSQRDRIAAGSEDLDHQFLAETLALRAAQTGAALDWLASLD